jgi:hypothetical protein
MEEEEVGENVMVENLKRVEGHFHQIWGYN